MRLGLNEVSGMNKDGICAYEVNGLPAGEHAKIAYYDRAWHILRWNDAWHGNWAGSYPTADAALDGLREEIMLPL